MRVMCMTERALQLRLGSGGAEDHSTLPMIIVPRATIRPHPSACSHSAISNVVVDVYSHLAVEKWLVG